MLALGTAEPAQLHGATGVFRPVLDGKELTFTADGDEFVDEGTKSRWDIFGTSTSGPLQGQRFESLTHVDTFWFAWASYLPDTSVVAPGE